jgi:hypothetical protein
MSSEANQILATVGLLFDLVGASLLGVEAIKLENIRRVSNTVDTRIESVLAILNPQIEVVDKSDEAPSSSCFPWLVVWSLGMLLLGILLLVAIYSLLTAAGVPPVDRWSSSIPSGVRIPVVAILIVFLAMMLSTTVVGLVIPTLTRAFVATVGILDVHTPTGGVGIAGICMLAIGFSLQIIGTWA